MRVTKDQNLNTIPTDVFNVLIGYEEEEKANQKKRATKRSFEARRAIEQHFEDKQLQDEITELWFNK
ncbi:MAG: PA3496 family putative envelope integrity protein [Pontibacterium sp.]